MSPVVQVTTFEPHPLAENARILLDRPILPGQKAGFASAAEAEGHSLFARFFGIHGVKAVAAEHDTILVWRDRAVPWAPILEAAKWILRDWFLDHSPPSAVRTDETLEQREARIRAVVQDVLDHQVNPTIAGHEGRIVLLDVKDTVVYVEMQGGCQGCGMSWFTLKRGLVAAVRAQAPDVSAVHDTTDHAAGSNPYYAKPQPPAP